MRVLKFRAWDKTNKKMLDRVIAGPGDPCSTVWDDEDKQWKAFDEGCGDIMQFTGLLDKNGKEIYESDIIQCYLSKDFGPVTRVVEFKDGCFRVRDLEVSYVGRKEVIGNIYEHPELMKDHKA